jgi:ABC-type sugar transport system ATPase subunit
VGHLASQTNLIASSLEQTVRQLSGGNQQKVVFARAPCRNPQVVVAPGPIRGVDVGAKEQLYALLRDLAFKGAWGRCGDRRRRRNRAIGEPGGDRVRRMEGVI